MALAIVEVEISDIEIGCFISPWNVRINITLKINNQYTKVDSFDYPRLEWDTLRKRLLQSGFTEGLKIETNLDNYYIYKLSNIQDFKRIISE